MQLLDLRLVNLPGISTPPGERRGHVLDRRTLPRADLVRMHAIRLRQLGQCHLFADRFKRDLRLEISRMRLSLCRFGSSLSSCDPP